MTYEEIEMYKHFTEAEWNQLGIFELRKLGRRLGMASPTSMKAGPLLDEIKKILAGKEPEPRTKSGRPPKNSEDLNAQPKGFQNNDNNINNRTEGYNLKDHRPRPVVTVKDNDKADIKNDIAQGILEILGSGFGFLRINNFQNSEKDVYVSNSIIKSCNLKKGDKVTCFIRRVRDNESPAMTEVIKVNDDNPALCINRGVDFDDLVPDHPNERIRLETANENSLAIRCVDLIAPIGKGQRALIVSPPKAGKTTLLKKIAQSIENNNKNIKLFVLLVDERPEEVTDFKKSIKSEVVYSTFDETAEHHIKGATLLLSHARRLVETGKDVVILLDSITRLARAYNTCQPPSGRTLSGGLDPASLYEPKRFFGSARNITGNGSLTIIATALIDTGSRMDDVIYEEFKGTGNMEIHLSRELSERRIFPAIDLYKSGTRKEELLLSKEELECAYRIRQALSRDNNASERLLSMLEKTRNNNEFISRWLKVEV